MIIKLLVQNPKYEAYPDSNQIPNTISNYISSLSLRDCYLLVDYFYIDINEKKNLHYQHMNILLIM